jgi:hypothetical protein
MDGDFSTEALKAKQRKDIPPELIVCEGGRTSGCPRSGPVAHDVVLEAREQDFSQRLQGAESRRQTSVRRVSDRQ